MKTDMQAFIKGLKKEDLSGAFFTADIIILFTFLYTKYMMRYLLG